MHLLEEAILRPYNDTTIQTESEQRTIYIAKLSLEVIRVHRGKFICFILKYLILQCSITSLTIFRGLFGYHN